MNGKNWFYYYGNGTEKWFIGPNKGSDITGVRIRSVELCAEDIQTNEWEAYSSGKWPKQENASVKCVDDQVNGNGENSESSVPENRSNEAPSTKNDPRDMYFIFENWTEILESSEVGTKIESKNYPGGIFRTDEGYEFQLWIYPKELNHMQYSISLVYHV